jgi:AmmeMemoRadiSam system protein A
VTLTKAGQLRGCVGHLLARRPLYQTILENTRNAAVADPRFPAVQPDELAQIAIELSVLTELQPLPYSTPSDLLAKLRPHVDGVVLHQYERMTTFLPQVWEQLPDKLEFLDRLAQKAGGPPQAWRLPGARISVYQVEAFGEPAGTPT